MSNTETPTEAKPPKRRFKRILMLLLALIVIGGGGVAAGVYATGGNLLGGPSEAVDPNQPQLMVRSDADPAAIAQAKAQANSRNGRPDPRVFQATYVPLEGEFTSNLGGGDAFVQLGLGISTYYDERVPARLSAHNMAIRSAVLMTLSEQDPAEITTLSGKEALKQELKNTINSVLTTKEGFGGIDDVYFTSFVTQ